MCKAHTHTHYLAQVLVESEKKCELVSPEHHWKAIGCQTKDCLAQLLKTTHIVNDCYAATVRTNLDFSLASFSRLTLYEYDRFVQLLADSRTPTNQHSHS